MKITIITLILFLASVLSLSAYGLREKPIWKSGVWQGPVRS